MHFVQDLRMFLDKLTRWDIISSPSLTFVYRRQNWFMNICFSYYSFSLTEFMFQEIKGFPRQVGMYKNFLGQPMLRRKTKEANY